MGKGIFEEELECVCKVSYFNEEILISKNMKMREVKM